MYPVRSYAPGPLLVVLSLALAAPLQAQTANAAAWQASPASLLKNTLRGVAAAEAHYYAANRTYAPSAERLDLKPESGVRIEILGASANGWQAKASYKDQRGRSCVIFTGSLEGAEAPRTDGDREMAGEDGVPLCDRMR
jgi:hypothetical protein